MRSLKITNEYAYQLFSVMEGEEVKLDHRKIAKDFAEFLLANGYVHALPAHRSPDSDVVEYRFAVYMFKKMVDLP